jgi:acetyl esterase/lipase
MNHFQNAVIMVALGGAIFSGSAAAQLSAIPPEVAAKVRAFGPVFNAETSASFRALYAPLHAPLGPDIVVKTDIAYGPDERHRLDVFAPAQKQAQPAPVVIYIHGGAYVRGDKTIPGTPFYQNIGAFWARNGIIGVNATYRLAPKHQWPAAAQDIGAAAKWVRANIAAYGGDRTRIVLMGHSSGAGHVATYIFHEELQPAGGDDGVVGAILLSGGYDPTTGSTAGRRAYFGEDESLYPARAAIRHVEGRTLPVFIGFAEYDPPRFQVQAVSLFKALCERDKRCPPMKQLFGHSHHTETLHLGTRDESLTGDLAAFVKGLK